ncbi:U1 small nuclear ribonucleoprotein 70 kDa homolog [Trichomonascus vanleenenianus]|uniref:U1 snRNP complex subunit SNP1 n=1 Tax=Trichomonascus vanleenenianus TaxID=2268995 RepID=UPI003ECB08E2
MTDVKRLPLHLANLFKPRPPLKYAPPSDIPPEHRKTKPIEGVAAYLEELRKPDPNYVPTESWLQKQQKEKKAQQEEHARTLKERIASWDPRSDPHVRGDPFSTLFIARLSYETTEQDLEREFARFGPIERVRIVTDNKTGKSRGYAFVVYQRERDLKAAYEETNGMKIHGRKILVDVERGRTVKNWRPRKLAGGLGGRHYTKALLRDRMRNSSPRGPRRNVRDGGGRRDRDDRRDERRDDRRDDRRPSTRYNSYRGGGGGGGGGSRQDYRNGGSSYRGRDSDHKDRKRYESPRRRY